MIIPCFMKLNPFWRSNLKFQTYSMLSWTRGIQIRFLNIANFGYLGFLSFGTKLRLKISPRKLNYFFGQTRIWFFAKNAVPYSTVQVSEFRKKFFERVISISVLPLTSASRKHVNSGGHPPNSATQKPHTFGIYSTRSSTWKSSQKLDV